jgi:hypothetical protein
LGCTGLTGLFNLAGLLLTVLTGLENLVDLTDKSSSSFILVVVVEVFDEIILLVFLNLSTGAAFKGATTVLFSGNIKILYPLGLRGPKWHINIFQKIFCSYLNYIDIFIFKNFNILIVIYF